MAQIPILTSIIFMLFLGVVVTLLIRADDLFVVNRNSRHVGIFASVTTLIMSLFLLRVSWTGATFIPQREVWSMGNFSHITIVLGVDQLSIVMLILSSFLFFIIHISDGIKPTRHREYIVALLLTQAIVTGFWCVQNMLMFYILFEMVLIPLFYMIGIWGGEKRYDAAFKFILVTAAGSFLFLFSLLIIYKTYGTFDFSELHLRMQNIPPHPLVWWGMMAAFAIKTPMLFVHAWLPRAHVEAPTSASMILAGILLKFGVYGMMRCLVHLMPDMTAHYAEVFRILSVAALVYASAAAFVQADMKRMIAYASVAHMGVVTLGIFSLTSLGFQGAFFQMVSHGIVSSALFYCLGLLHTVTGTRNLTEVSGLGEKNPVLIGCLGVFVFALIGLPGTSGFIGEILVFLGIPSGNIGVLVVAVSGLVLSSAYGLRLIAHLGFGPYRVPESARLCVLGPEEKFTLACFVAVIVWLGIFPEHLRGYAQPALEAIVPIARQISIGRPLDNPSSQPMIEEVLL
ncbi:MAG: NADH-quinone oxidoreductase subunit M [Alphaproteobacteria bacterium]|nr:MAG: NADH-quinone oxidoreductase subunit M [Alphaproteobacteria bacterium]